MKKIKEIEQYVIEDKLDSALDILLSIFENLNEESLINEVILILSRLNEYKRKSNQGVLDSSTKEISNIRLSILNLKTSAAKIYKEQKSKSSGLIAKQSIVLLDEEFKNNLNEWGLGDYKEGNVITINSKIYAERLVVEKFISDNFNAFEYLSISINSKNNFLIRSRISILNFKPNNNSGIVWGMKDVNNYFQFVISIQGKFLIKYRFEGYDFIIKEWTSSDSINIDNHINSLEINKKNNLYYFLINSDVVYTCPFLKFFGSKVGVCLFNKCKIAVDEYYIEN